MARGFNYAAGASNEVDEARNPDLDKTALQTMGRSKNAYVREIIAGRADCPLGLMVTLVHDYVPDVRIAVAGNASALQSVMEYLARDKHPGVLGALVHNPALPLHVLTDLASHKRREVRELALGLLDDFGSSPGESEDHATPELRDRVFDDRRAELAELAAHEAGPAPEPFLPEPLTFPRESAPTRTAPVRGFRAPNEVRL